MSVEVGHGGGLPPGLVPMPEYGPDVVGTRVPERARRTLIVKGVAWAVGAAAAFALSVQGTDSLGGLVLGLVLGSAFGFLAAVNLAPVRLGGSPALTIDATTVRSHVPLSRVAVRLAAITRVRLLRRDLLLEARGGVERRGRPTRERWAAISPLHAFDVDREDLAAYLTARAEAARAAR